LEEGEREGEGVVYVDLSMGKEEEDGERASIEYRPSIGMNENQPVIFKRVQTLGRFNGQL
jgi:hypothetical protein